MVSLRRGEQPRDHRHAGRQRGGLYGFMRSQMAEPTGDPCTGHVPGEKGLRAPQHPAGALRPGHRVSEGTGLRKAWRGGRLHHRDDGAAGGVLLSGVHAYRRHFASRLRHGGLLSGRKGRHARAPRRQRIHRHLAGQAAALSALCLPSPRVLAADRGGFKSRGRQDRLPEDV